MFGILDRYIGRVIFMSILLCELTLVGLAALIKHVEQLSRSGKATTTCSTPLLRAASMPKEAVLFFPGGPARWPHRSVSLATSPELVVMQAAGRSKIASSWRRSRPRSPDVAGGDDGRDVAPAAKADGG